MLRPGLAVPRRRAERDGRLAQCRTEWPRGYGIVLAGILASGEDPNFGPYNVHVRKALRSIIASQEPNNGCLGPGNMYHHGFAMLALAEAYGAVDDRNLWEGETEPESFLDR